MERRPGNTGIALAMIGRIKGYPVKIVLPGNVSPERRQLLEAFGAEIIDSPAEEGLERAVRRAEALAPTTPSGRSSTSGQRGQPAGPLRGHGPEIWADCPEITHFVAGLGTSGTLLGVGTF
jgi:cysteine synthase B